MRIVIDNALLLCNICRERVHRFVSLPGAINPTVKATGKSPPSRARSRRPAASADTASRTTADSPRLLTLSEAAQHLGHVHRTTIMRWVHEGRLKCIRLSRKAILFEPAELDRFVREHRFSG